MTTSPKPLEPRPVAPERIDINGPQRLVPAGPWRFAVEPAEAAHREYRFDAEGVLVEIPVGVEA